MKAMKIYINVCFFLSVFFLSCMEDKGNYDYVTLNQIQIDTIHDCTIELFDTLRMSPKVTRSQGENGPLSYLWYKYVGSDGTNVDTISFEEKLNYKVSDLVGRYQIFLKVTDEDTGISEKTSFYMNVTGKFGAGLIILGEVDGKTDLIFINEAGNVIDLYGGDTGDLLGSNPVCVGDATAPNVNSLKDIMVLCDDGQGGKVLSNADFTISNDITDEFYMRPEGFKPQAYYRAYNKIFGLAFADFIISNKKLHVRTTYNEGDMGKSVGFNPAVEGTYELCPYAIVCPAAYLFADNSGNGRLVILRQGMFSMDKVFSVLKSSAEGFDPSSLGMKCIYLSEAAKYNNKQSGFGIFRDNITGQLQGMRFSMGQYADSDYELGMMSLFSKTAITGDASGIDEATGYAMSLARPHLYYSKGSKVYFYGIDNNQCYPVYDVDTVSGLAHSVIDKIYMEYVTFGYTERPYGVTSDVYNTVLYISSHKEGENGSNGTVHVVKLKDNGTIDSRSALYRNVCGKTVSMYYKR